VPELGTLRVCFIAGTLGQGGAERQLFYSLQVLRDRGARPTVLCLTRSEYWEGKIRALGVPVTWAGRHASRVRRLADIIRLLRAERPQLIQSQHFYTNLYAYGAARTLGVQELGTLRSDAAHEVRASGAMLGRLSLMAPRIVVANSANALRNAVAMGFPADRLRLLPNAVDTAQFAPVPRPRSAIVTLLAVGSLIEVKRFDRLLNALAALASCTLPPWRTVIVGDGPLRPQLERQAAALGLLPHLVEFRGALSAVSTAYQQADVLVVCSDHEGTPNVILEAMASRLPVIATRVGGIDDVVQDGHTGILVSRNDECELADALKLLIVDRGLRQDMGDKARDHVVAQHSLEQLPARLTALYDSVIP
jgi:glycosyltransferase involved in cell wall biosynthesis